MRRLEPRNLVTANSDLDGQCTRDVEIAQRNDCQRCESTLGEKYIAKGAAVCCSLRWDDETIEGLVEVRVDTSIDARNILDKFDIEVSV